MLPRSALVVAGNGVCMGRRGRAEGEEENEEGGSHAESIPTSAPFLGRGSLPRRDWEADPLGRAAMYHRLMPGRTRLLLTGALFALLGPGCAASVPATEMRVRVNAPESDAPQPVEGPFARRLVAQGAVLLDVRSGVEHLLRHLDGSRSIPLEELPTRLEELGDENTAIVVYCLSGARSARAATLLSRAGFTRVYDVGSMFAY